MRRTARAFAITAARSISTRVRRIIVDAVIATIRRPTPARVKARPGSPRPPSTRQSLARVTAVLGRLLLLGALDQRRRDDQRAAARDDEPVARQLVECARDGLAAAADHVRELL